MDKKSVLAIAHQYAYEVIKEMSPDKILLFGSYANGNAKEESDIDIAVVFNGFNGDWFHTCTKLSSLTWKVSTYIEPVLLDSQDNKNGFVREVLRTGELVYQQD
jgi:predicted nucleotidyltransferase